jgi:hypothetical protein
MGWGLRGFFLRLGLELWQPVAYFTLTVVAAFVLSHLFFGVGSAIFLFSRGVSDSGLIGSAEVMLGSMKPAFMQTAELWAVFFIMLVLAVNLPLCLWASHLGVQRSVRMLYRIRGRPLKPLAHSEPTSNLILIVALSSAVGLLATLILSYA